MGSQQLQAGFSVSAALANFPGMHPSYASSQAAAASSYFGLAAGSASSVSAQASDSAYGSLGEFLRSPLLLLPSPISSLLLQPMIKHAFETS